MPSTHHGILIHIIFSTKNRMPLIDASWQDDLFAYIGGTVHDHKAAILRSDGIEDHIHLLAKIIRHLRFPKPFNCSNPTLRDGSINKAK